MASPSQVRRVRVGAITLDLPGAFRFHFWTIFKSLIRDVKGPIALWAGDEVMRILTIWVTPRGFDGPFVIFSTNPSSKVNVLNADLLDSHYLKFGGQSLLTMLRERLRSEPLSSISALAVEFHDHADTDDVQVIPWIDGGGTRLAGVRQDAVARRIDHDAFADTLHRLHGRSVLQVVPAPGGIHGELKTNMFDFTDALMHARENARTAESVCVFRVEENDMYFIFDRNGDQESEIWLGEVGSLRHGPGRRAFDSPPFVLRAFLVAMEPMMKLRKHKEVRIDIIVTFDPGNWSVLHNDRAYWLAVTHGAREIRRPRE